MVRMAIVGLGKMGLSHLSIVRAHPQVEMVGMCDTSSYLVEMLSKFTGIPPYTDFEKMLENSGAEAVIVATPSRFHAPLVRTALDRGLHVFCEKPFCLDPTESAALAEMATKKNLANQVGYHFRSVASFGEVKHLLEQNAIGKVHHARIEAYGPVVLRSKGSTWRTRKEEGGGCLYDYAAHALNLLNWYFDEPESVFGVVLGKIFSADSEDEAYGTIQFPGGISAQLSANWSDESYRKMSVRLTVWGTAGHIYADRQECRAYLRNEPENLPGYSKGWNVHYTTDLTPSVWFYVRGEEYSAQVDEFVQNVLAQRADGMNSFASAAATDRLLAMFQADAQKTRDRGAEPVPAGGGRKSLFGRFARQEV